MKTTSIMQFKTRTQYPYICNRLGITSCRFLWFKHIRESILGFLATNSLCGLNYCNKFIKPVLYLESNVTKQNRLRLDLTPLSPIFQLYHSNQFYQWWNDLGHDCYLFELQINASHLFYRIIKGYTGNAKTYVYSSYLI